ncbi:MAG: transcriptional regulator [Planctomycetota bacterium]|nr:MAG: transcriptional regulator [Planctomycetota bacterium]
MMDHPLDPTLWREGQDFEAKEAQGQDGAGKLPRSFWETYSAMANSDGGQVVLGVKEQANGRLELMGIARPDAVLKELWDQLNNPQRVSANLLQSGDARVETIDGKSVITITIPRAERSQRPVYLGGNPLTGTYRRGHEGDYRCSPEQVKRLLADASQRPRDGEVLPHYGLDDLDADSLSAYRNLFRSVAPGHPFLAGDDHDLLRQLGGWATDRETGSEGLTVAGLVMFGRQRSILDQLPYFHLDYQRLPPDNQAGAPRWIDRVTIDGTWAGNLFEFYRRIWPRLTETLRVPFQLGPDMQRRDETPQHEALREALINALIHADHAGRGGIRVRRLRSGFEFINPGCLRLPVEQVRAGGRSDPRNPALQQMFQMLGWGEKAGSGYPKIRMAWQEQHWRTPSLTEDRELDETHLRLTTESLLPQEVMSELDQRFPGRLAAIGELGRIALATAHIEESVNNRRLQELTDRAGHELTALLQDLCTQGLMDKTGRTTGTIYRVADAPVQADDAEAKEVSLGAKGVSLGAKEVSSGAKGVSSGAKGPSSTEPGADPVKTVAQSQRVKPAVLRAALMQLCRTDYRRPDELAAILDRTAKTLQNKYLGPMVKEGLLEALHAEPTHPRQAYRVRGGA